MKSIRILLLLACAGIAMNAGAQYYEAANQLANLISPALSGSANYRGVVEATGTVGVGNNRASFAGISTTQGFQYNSWFFMGAGLGIDVARANNSSGLDQNSRFTETQAMLPVFTDFRFDIGAGQAANFFIDLKLGAAWFLGNDYLKLNTVYMGHGAQFLMRPTVGVRIPISTGSRQAFNIGVTYQLLTSGNNYSYNGSSVTLSSFGASVSFEW